MPRGETPATKNEMPLSLLLPFFDLRVGLGRSPVVVVEESAWHTTRLVEEGGFFFNCCMLALLPFFGERRGGGVLYFPPFFTTTTISGAIYASSFVFSLFFQLFFSLPGHSSSPSLLANNEKSSLLCLALLLGQTDVTFFATSLLGFQSGRTQQRQRWESRRNA